MRRFPSNLVLANFECSLFLMETVALARRHILTIAIDRKTKLACKEYRDNERIILPVFIDCTYQ